MNPLRAYREKHCLSQQELADKLGCSRQLVSFLETGGRDVSAEMAITIEEKLGIDRVITCPSIFRKRIAA